MFINLFIDNQAFISTANRRYSYRTIVLFIMSQVLK